MSGNSFYNPYMYNNAMNIGKTAFSKPGLFNGLFKKFSLSSFLSGANKTLNVVNQAIPIYYQIKPMVTNAKTMFKVMKEIKKPNNKTNINNKTKEKEKEKESNYINDGAPTFFI